MSVCAVAVLVELWFLSVILLFILTFNVFPICENLHCSDANWLFILTVYFHLLETTSFQCNFPVHIEAWCIFDFAYTFSLHPFFEFWYASGLLVVYLRYFWYSLWLQYMFVLHIVLYCFVTITTHILFPIYILEALTHILAYVF